MKYLKVNRDSGGRGRYIYTNGDKDISLTGVTTILNESAKPFLIDWAAKTAYEDSIGKTDTEVRAIIKDKTYAHKRKKNEATDKGTLAHDYVDEFILDYIKTGKYIKKHIEDEDVRVSVERFYDWAIFQNVEFLEPDSSVYDPQLMYAGSFDFICRIDGVIYLGDFKTSKHMDDNYPAQCAAYIKARKKIEEIEGLTPYDIRGSVIVRSTLAKEDQVFFKKSSSGAVKKEVVPAFEVKMSTAIDLDFQYFFSCLFLYKYKKAKQVQEWNSLEIDKSLEIDYNDNDIPLEEF
jgi:hypothetical protein